MQKLIFIFTTLLLNVCSYAKAELNTNLGDSVSIYLNPTTGNDQNIGSKEFPLKTLPEAAKRINKMNGLGEIQVVLSSGTYGLNETATFNPSNWKFELDKRLIIRAEITPNHPDWNPSKLPILVSTMPFKVETDKNKKITGGSNYGIEINTSFVTIQGLRILGEPVHEKPSEGVLVRNYPIVWEGNQLSGLRITQCLFLGNKFALPNHLGILANGNTLEVDHCVFYGVKDAVVMWNSKSSKSSFHHNLVLNIYGAAVWTWSTTEDFSFYNNVINNANVFWVLDKEEKYAYKISNSMLIGFNQLVNKGGGPQDFGIPANKSKLIYQSDFIIKKEGKLAIEEDQTNRYYLQLKPGTLGTKYNAGLFYK